MSEVQVTTPKEDNDLNPPRAVELNKNGVTENSTTNESEVQKVAEPEKEMIEKVLADLAVEPKEQTDKKEITNKEKMEDLEDKGAGDCPVSSKPAVINEPLENKESTQESPVDNADKAPIVTDQGSRTTPVINGNSASPTSDGKTGSPNIKELNPSELVILELKQALQKTAEERDNYRKKFECTEEKLATVQASYDAVMAGGNDDNTFKQMIEQLRCKLIQTSLQLNEKAQFIAHQEKQINALNNQVSSLKEVETLTRSLLQIRNMEVKHLQSEVDDMEERITQERERYNSMINKMDAAVQLNAELKKEYETQLTLFKDLKEKYEEKVALLTKEKQDLENTLQPISD